MNILLSFMGRDTPEFDGRIKHMSRKKWNGNVPFYATHFVTDDPSVREELLNKGVIEYGKAQKEQQEEEQIVTEDRTSANSYVSVEEADKYFSDH